MTSLKLLHNDLSALDIRAFADSGVWQVINHPITGQPLVNDKGQEWRMLLAGKDSAVYRKAQSEAVQRRFAGGNKLTPEIMEDEAIQLLSACVLGFEYFVTDGKELPFNAENAFMLVERFPWLRDQIEAVILDRERYFLDNMPA